MLLDAAVIEQRLKDQEAKSLATMGWKRFPGRGRGQLYRPSSWRGQRCGRNWKASGNAGWGGGLAW